MNCKNCGTKIKKGAAFCPQCGAPAGAKKAPGERAARQGAVAAKGLPVSKSFAPGKGIAALLAILAIGALSLMGYRVYCILSVGALEKKVAELSEERKDLAGQLADREQEVQRMEQYLDALTDTDEGNREQQIREAYIARQEAESAARSLILAKLSDASYITLDAASESVGEMLTDEVIDSLTGNALVSAGVKEGIAAAAQEMSIENILSSAAAGMAAELPDYIAGEITGAAADALGVDLFGVTDWISRFMNADDTPVMLANTMVTEQRNDVTCVLGFLEKEELTGADMQYMAGVMERIKARGDELEAAGSSAGGDFSGAKQLEELAQVWERNNYKILYYGRQEEQ
ncbi:MAG: zinc-ribbon domain-containing protein [Blautia sp.]|nr:zinc-ribbon domain-containing protein [Lachnoclostridium sp.]MCM1212753.1 zinc-ribbon domain-containing protein [Blautia sp.]